MTCACPGRSYPLGACTYTGVSSGRPRGAFKPALQTSICHSCRDQPRLLRSQGKKQAKGDELKGRRVGSNFFVKVLLITTDNDPRCVILRLDLVHSLKLAHEGANARRNSQEKNPSESREPVQVRHLSIHRGPPLGSVRTLKGFSNFFLQSLCTLLLANLKGLGHLFMVNAASICAA